MSARAVSSLYKKERERESSVGEKNEKACAYLTAGVTGCSEATNGRTVPLKDDAVFFSSLLSSSSGVAVVLPASSSSSKPFLLRVLLRVMNPFFFMKSMCLHFSHARG